MTSAQVMQILLARRGLLLAVALLVIVATAAGSLLSRKIYVAEVSVVAESKNTDPVTGAPLPQQANNGYSAAQVDIVASRNVALKVVKKLNLTQSEKIQAEFSKETESRGEISDWMADKLLRQLAVQPARNSNVIRISVESAEAAMAARLANAFAEAYLQTSLELKVEPARRQATWFGEQVQDLRSAMESAQERLSTYQRKENILGNNDRIDVENGRLAELSDQLVKLQAAAYDAKNRSTQMNDAIARGRLEEVPDILGNTLLQSMKADLARAEAKFADVAAHYESNHPQYRSAAAEVRSFKEKLLAELNTVKGSVEQTAQLAALREEETQRALGLQKERLLQLTQQRDAGDLLNREVENAQRAYDAGLQRFSQVRLESQLDQSNIAILSPAIEPLHPARPRIVFNLILAAFLGAALGAGSAIIAEMLDRRVRTRGDLDELAGLPVLAEVPPLSSADESSHKSIGIFSRRVPWLRKRRETLLHA